MSRWSVCWRKIKKPRRILAQSPCVLQIFHVICHYLRFSIINLISIAWTSLEREREGECRFPCSFMFFVYWLIQRQCWIIHIACFQIFFPVRNKQERKNYFIWQLICVSLRIKPEEWSPSEAHAKLSLWQTSKP